MRGNWPIPLVQDWVDHFNSRLYMRGNAKERERMRVLDDFNSRLYMRGNPAFSAGRSSERKISIHASTWEATSLYLLISSSGIFQFTPLHERQRIASLRFGITRYISIHASTWEATYDARRIRSLGNGFQFTPLHERQLARGWIISASIPFQFTPLHERQHLAFSVVVAAKLFQFTPLHERQPVSGRNHGCVQYFNSRLYMRGNGDGVYGDGWLEISIHASTWEATQREHLWRRWKPISIHASTWEATYWGTGWICIVFISIHASTWEATAKTYNLFDKIDIIFYQTLFFL